MKTTALITGATSGIGRAAAIRLAAEGFRLILTGRRNKLLAELQQELRKNYETETLALCFDVCRYDEVEKNLAHLPQEWQAVNILINNAGLAAGLAPIHEGLVDDWERMIDTNIKGLLYVTRCIAPGMAARRSGHIVNLGSIAGKEVYPNGGVYCATKHAVAAITQAMRLELAAHGVRVTQICPGAAETEFSIVRFKGDRSRASNVYQGFSPLAAADVANAIYYAVTAPDHVNVQDVLIMPKAQASAGVIYRNETETGQLLKQ
ncbi:MAG: SDR family NAD(P)-dependent oxidoreductase [Tannerellaceae bacterium]|jgi:NADP-dependent 3-hydroxy acid dehydrogenase YdfG|nr:SDR family NAD(P)-dependent oxidoreductase [Tannerellaceae bacterium]